MRKNSYVVKIFIDVHDSTALQSAAKTFALKDGLSEKEWDDLRATNMSGIAADLHMLLDPGKSPDGTEIVESEVGFIEGDLDDDDECICDNGGSAGCPIHDEAV